MWLTHASIASICSSAPRGCSRSFPKIQEVSSLQFSSASSEVWPPPVLTKGIVSPRFRKHEELFSTSILDSWVAPELLESCLEEGTDMTASVCLGLCLISANCPSLQVWLQLRAP